jgi:HSP20 family protein
MTQTNTQTHDDTDTKTSTQPHAAQPRSSAAPRRLVPPVDVLEGPDEVRVLADLPGVLEESLKIELDRGTLRLAATRHAGDRELAYERTFELGRDLDPDGIGARLEHGVLTVRVPRKTAPPARQIPISVG